MRIHELLSTHAKKSSKRLGRGTAGSGGKTAGRGTKGQKARTGANSNIPRAFDGGAANFIQRLPKLKGFKSRRVKPVTVNLAAVARHFDDKATISLISLVETGLVDAAGVKRGVKIVGASGELSKTFSFDTSDSRLTVSSRLQAK